MTHQLPNGYEAVTVPKDRHIKRGSFFINNVNYLRYTYFTGKDGRYPSSSGVDLPNGHYTLIGLASKITEEEAREIVESFIVRMRAQGSQRGYIDLDVYTNYIAGNHSILACNTALESFYSLLTSLSLDPDTTVIIKKENV